MIERTEGVWEVRKGGRHEKAMQECHKNCPMPESTPYSRHVKCLRTTAHG